MPTDEKEASKSDLRRIGLWGVANSIAQKFQMENAVLEKQLGKPFDMVPFGNLINVSSPPAPQAQSFFGKAAQAAVLALALGGGGLGLASLSGLIGQKAIAPVVPVVAPKASEELPLSIDWEFSTDARRTDTTE